MRIKLFTGIGLITAVALIIVGALTQPAAGQTNPLIEEITFTAGEFAAGTGVDFAVTTAGLGMAETAVTTLYTSPPIEAPIPFNAVVPQWEANLPEGASLNVMLRTKTNETASWSAWQPIHAHGDWTLPEETLQVGEMLVVPESDGTHTYVQYSLSLSRYLTLTTPVVEQFTLTFIDSTAGPTAAEMIEQQQAIDAAKGETAVYTTGYPRPTVISREVWCIADDCDYTADLEYSPATHLIVHHTVSSNSSANWAATVRAIWSFHTYNRDWGDIGYNYLIDQDGVIYEGHQNEDFQTMDVVGTHASGANTGSMGVALIGTFTAVDFPDLPGIPPTTPMVDSAVELLSWKADQRQIDVFDASATLPNLNWGLPHLTGHRAVYGTTECPGDQANLILGTLRQRVATNIGLVDPHQYVSELSTNFRRSNVQWASGPNECGTNEHAFYAWSTTNPASSTHWGEWRPTVPTPGTYRIQVRVPYCNTGRGETSGAVYTITHASGATDVAIDQESNLGLWITLGDFELEAGSGTVVRLSNLTSTDSGLGVWFDDLRLLEVEPELTTTAPADQSWSNSRTVTFDWSLSAVLETSTTTLTASTNPQLTNPVISKTWSSSPMTYSHSFTEDMPQLYWQVTTVVNSTGQTLTSPIAQFGIDTAVPSSHLDKVYQFTDRNYLLRWSGNDSGSGLAGYDLTYRVISDTTWIPIVTDALQTAVSFTAPYPNTIYEFRLVATDAAGNVEQKSEPDLNSAQAINLPHAIMIPIVEK